MHKLSHYLEDQAKRQLDDRDLTSRSDLRKERKQTELDHANLARALCECTKKQLDRLELGEALLQVVIEARRIVSPAAKDRALRLVRRELRNGDTASVRRQLQALQRPTPQRQANGEAEQWSIRLVTEGAAALNAFTSTYPTANRQRLRQLLLAAKKSTASASAKSNRALVQVLQESIGGAVPCRDAKSDETPE